MGKTWRDGGRKTIWGGGWLDVYTPGAKKFVKRDSNRMRRRHHKRVVAEAIAHYTEDKCNGIDAWNYSVLDNAWMWEAADEYLDQRYAEEVETYYAGGYDDCEDDYYSFDYEEDIGYSRYW